MNLKNKIVVIAGGCGQIGYPTAKRLSAQGARIFVLVRSNLDQAKIKMLELSNPELEHKAIFCDITDTDSIKLAIAEIKTYVERCDILINAAGTNKTVRDFRNLTDEIFTDIIKTNLQGPFNIIREFVGLLWKSEDPLIINISSTSSLRPSINNFAYGAAKAGLNSLTKSLAMALAPKVRVLAIAPGFLENPTSGNIARTSEESENLKNRVPLKRLGTGDSIASTIEGLTMYMPYATGEIIVVDGGLTV